MSQHYSDSARADEQYALPDLETFYNYGPDSPFWNGDADMAEGWYYWFCFPGCLPDSEQIGPYASEQLAIDAAKEPGEDVTDVHWREDGDDNELFMGGY